MIILRTIVFSIILLSSGGVQSKTKIEHFTTSDSIRIGYVQLGSTSSPSLIFIHGGPGDNSSDFRSMAEKLSSTYHVIAFDSRGCGFSQRGLSNSQLTIDKMVNDVKELQDHLGLTSSMILGHSFGGAVAIEFSLLHPERVDKLILCAPVISAAKAQRNRMEIGYQDGLVEGDSAKIEIYQRYIMGDSISIQDEAKMISLSHSWHDPKILDSV